MRLCKYIAFLLFLLYYSASYSQSKKTILAMGDGYTLGEGVRVMESWPFQLLGLLNDSTAIFQDPKVRAKTGWKSEQLLKEIKGKAEKKFDLIFLMIGMNDQYQSTDIELFENNLIEIIEECFKRAHKKNESIVVLSIPDYSYSPKGQANKKKIHAEIEQMNKILESLCANKQIQFIDINPHYQKTLKSPGFLASNKIHPSANMYQLWAKEIFKQLKEEQ